MKSQAILQDLSDLAPTLHSMTSYADALTAAVARKGDFEIDGLIFKRRTDINIPTDYISTGRHTMVYELLCSGKTYKIMIEPVQETHAATRTE